MKRMEKYRITRIKCGEECEGRRLEMNHSKEMVGRQSHVLEADLAQYWKLTPMITMIILY